MAKRDRNSYWVNGQIQGALAIRIIIHWLIFAVIAAVLTFTMQFLGEPLVPFKTHLRNLWANQGIFGLVILILMPLFVYDSVRLSHRFAGPIVRVRRVMQAIAKGQAAERLKFRDKDFWSGLAEDFNTLLDQGYLVARVDSGSDVESELASADDVETNADNETELTAV